MLSYINHAENVEQYYPKIVNLVLKYIVEVRKNKKEFNSLLDIIYDFCMKNDIDVEIVGDAIRSDLEFSEYIAHECEQLKNVRKSIGKW